MTNVNIYSDDQIQEAFKVIDFQNATESKKDKVKLLLIYFNRKDLTIPEYSYIRELFKEIYFYDISLDLLPLINIYYHLKFKELSNKLVEVLKTKPGRYIEFNSLVYGSSNKKALNHKFFKGLLDYDTAYSIDQYKEFLDTLTKNEYKQILNILDKNLVYKLNLLE